MVKDLKIPSRGDDTVLPDQTQATGDNRFVPASTIIYFAGRLREAERDRKAANKKYSGIRKQFKNTGVSLGIFDTVSRLAELDDPDAFEKYFDEASHIAKAFAIAPPGTQLSLEDFLSDVEQAKKKGFIRGMQGDDPDRQAYPENTELGQAHIEGWNEAQAERRAQFVAENKAKAEQEKAEADRKAALAAKAEARAAKKADKVPTNTDGETVQ